MSSITAFMLNGWFMSHNSNHNVGKGPFVYEQTYSWLFNAVVYMAFFLSNNIYCLQMLNFDGQEDDQAAYDLSPSWLNLGPNNTGSEVEHKLRWAFSCGNCNSLSLPEACLFYACDKEIHVNCLRTDGASYTCYR